MKPHFVHKKSLGQNFLEDEGLLESLVTLSCVNESDTVLEIGAGMGCLSKQLAKKCARLLSIELDERLFPFIELALSGYTNFRLIHADANHIDLDAMFAGEGRLKVVANLPYYITSEIMEKLFLSNLQIDSISVMLQKEAALRMVASAGEEGYGPISVLREVIAAFGGQIEVDRSLFTPPPNVDSLFIHLPFLKNPPMEKQELLPFYKFVKRCFLNRRKTLANNLLPIAARPKAGIEDMLLSLGFSKTVRTEELHAEELIKLYKEVKKG